MDGRLIDSPLMGMVSETGSPDYAFSPFIINASGLVRSVHAAIASVRLNGKSIDSIFTAIRAKQTRAADLQNFISKPGTIRAGTRKHQGTHKMRERINQIRTGDLFRF